MATTSNIKHKNIGELQNSPSDDPWFYDPENMASVKRGIAEMKAGKGRAYTIDEIRDLLGV